MTKQLNNTLRGKLKVKHGFAFKGEYFSDKGEFIVLTPGNFHEHGGFKREPGKEKYYTSDIPADYLLEKGELLVAMTEQAQGLLGSSALVPESGIYLHNQRLGLIEPVEGETHKEFLYHFFNWSNVRRQIQLSSTGSKVKHTSPDRIYDVQVKLPDVLVQKRIAATLSALDQKIELNNKINAELEAMAKLIYDYWFVQFDFPDENGKPYKSSGGKMVYNEELKREIPEGWEVMPLAQVEENIVTGKTPSTEIEEYYGGNVPFICIGDVRGNMHVTETELTLTQEGANTQANKFIPSGAICVTCIASPGLIAFATENSQTNQQLNSIVCESEENRYYLYFYLKDYFRFAKAKTGNTFANMNKGDFSAIQVIKPSNEALIQFEDKVQSVFNRILIASKENQELASLRDWLLPMLMNGQVKVGEGKEVLKAAEDGVGYGKIEKQ